MIIFCPSVWADRIFDATVHWYNNVPLSLPVSGVVKKVFVKSGDQVKKGQVLISLDKTVFQARVNALLMAFKAAAADFSEAEKEWNRAQALYDRTVLSDYELQIKKNALLKSKSDHAYITYRLKQSQWMLEKCDLIAPFGGVIVNTIATPNQVIEIHDQIEPLIQLAVNTEFLAIFEVSLSSLATFSKSATVWLALSDNKEQWFKGSIYFIGMEPIRMNNKRPYYQVQVKFNTTDNLIVGQGVIIRLSAPREMK